MNLSKQTGLCVLVAVLFTATVVAEGIGTETSQQVEIAEAYSIYSLLIAKELEHSPVSRYAIDLIAQQTVTKGWLVHAVAGRSAKGVRECIDVPTSEAQEYDSAISDFEHKNSSSVALSPRLTLEKPYLLLGDSDVLSYRQTMNAMFGFGAKDFRPDHRFDGGSALISLSRIGFSKEGNVAVVYAQHDCGPTCAGGSLHVFKKQGDKWDELNVVRCAWDA